jgi:hypothetical protein
LVGGALLACGLAVLLSPSSVARADGDAGGDEPDVARLADGRSQKTTWVPPGESRSYGHADVLVHASLAAVKKQVLDFGRYKDLVPEKFHNAHVIGKQSGGTDVYMQLPIMRGLVTLWQVMRFYDLHPLAPGWAIVEGFFVKGNLKGANTTWTMRAIDDETTWLQLDLLVVPLVPAPQSAVDEELRDAAMQGVDAMRDRAQGAPGPVPYVHTAPKDGG